MSSASAGQRALKDLLSSYNELNSAIIDELDEKPSPLEFMRYVARNRPFIVREGAAEWDACQKWNSSYLAKTLGEEPVRIAATPHGNADAVIHTASGLVFVKPHESTLPFTTALSLIVSQSSCADPRSMPTYYIQPQNNSLPTEYPQLASSVPATIDFARIALQQPAPDAVNFWLGNQYSTTSLHRDNYENIYVQILGRKVFTLLPPIAAPCIDERDLPAATFVRSSSPTAECGFEVRLDNPPATVPFATWDPAHPGVNATPFSHLAEPMRVTLEPGDMFYLPALWYHKVEQENSEEGISVSCNWWYDMDFSGGFWSTCSFIRDLARRKEHEAT